MTYQVRADEITELKILLARIEEKIDAQGLVWSEKFGGIEARLARLEASATSQGERLGHLEAAEKIRQGERRILTGILAMIGAVAGVIGALLVRLLLGS